MARSRLLPVLVGVAVVAVGMSFGGVNGCARRKGARDPAATTIPTEATAAPTETGHPNVNTDGQFPVVKNKETLQVSLAHNEYVVSYEYGENRLTTWLEDRTNVRVEFLVHADVDARAGLAVPLGDVCLLPMDRATAAARGADGTLLPLEGLIRRNAPRLTARLERAGTDTGALASPDGHVYALPAGAIEGAEDPDDTGMRLWIHTGFLERYTPGMPTTTEEFRAFLIWVRDADADGDGDDTDEIGWTGAESRDVAFARPTDFLMNAFTIQDADGYFVRDGAIGYAPVTDAYRDGLRWLAGLYADGLLDPDYPGHTPDSLRDRVAQNGIASAACVSARNLSSLSTDPAVQAQYTALPPLTGPEEVRYAWRYGYAGLDAARASIPADADQPEIAMAWLDAAYDTDVLLHARYGELGTDWFLTPTNTDGGNTGTGIGIGTSGEALRIDVRNEQWGVQTYAHWFDAFPTAVGLDASLRLLSVTAESDPAASAEAQAARVYSAAVIPCGVPPSSLDAEGASRIADGRAAVDAYVRDAVTDFITGAADPGNDAAWADYLAGAQAAGLADCLAAMQAAYDADRTVPLQ